MDYANVKRDHNGWYAFAPQEKAQDDAAIAAHAAGQTPSTFHDRSLVGQEMSSGNTHLLGSPGYNEFKGGVGSSPLADAMDNPKNGLLPQADFAPNFAVQTQRGSSPVSTENYKSDPAGVTAVQQVPQMTPEQYNDALFQRTMADPNVPTSDKVRLMGLRMENDTTKQVASNQTALGREELGLKKETAKTENAMRGAVMTGEQKMAFDEGMGKPPDVSKVQDAALDAAIGPGFSGYAKDGGSTWALDNAMRMIKHAALDPKSPEVQRARQLVEANHKANIQAHLNDQNPSTFYPYILRSPDEARSMVKDMFGQPTTPQEMQGAGNYSAGQIVNSARIGLRKGHTTTNSGAGH